MQSFLVKTKAISRTITKQKVSSTSISSRALFGNEKCAFWRVIETQLVVSKKLADFRLHNSLTDHPGIHGAQKAIKFGESANFSTGLQMKEQTCRTGAPKFKTFYTVIRKFLKQISKLLTLPCSFNFVKVWERPTAGVVVRAAIGVNFLSESVDA